MYKTVIIDDITLVRDSIKLLGEWDLFGINQVFEASNARDGMEIIYREKPELIITDMRMPVMDGVQLLKQLEEESIKSKVIVISGFADFDYMRLAIKTKVIDYILKPIDPQDLNNAIATAIKQIENENDPDNELGIEDDNSPTNNQIIKEVLNYINKNYMAEISLSDLANVFYLSKEHLSRLFKKKPDKTYFHI